MGAELSVNAFRDIIPEFVIVSYFYTKLFSTSTQSDLFRAGDTFFWTSSLVISGV